MKLFILLCVMYSLPANGQSITPEQSKLLQALKPCLSPPEKLESLPVTVEHPRGKVSYTLHLNLTPLASDGFSYEITVYSAEKIAYITQFGGFAGVNKTFGPVNISAPCPLPTKPHKK